jgi:hypothetical protein
MYPFYHALSVVSLDLGVWCFTITWVSGQKALSLRAVRCRMVDGRA